VHVPTLHPAIEKALAKVELVPRGFEALMFAIYSMAVLSLTDDECKDILGETRAILLLRYVAATKAALSRAKFMSSTSIVVLQALVLHIMSIRDDSEPRAVWSFTGVAMRVAEGMGMRLDGALLGLSPFETEIRRRIWWQLNMHDFRAAELCGQAKFRNFTFDETTPKKPANVNDSELYPTMPRPAVDAIRPTEMIWCMFRSELAAFASGLIARMPKLGKTAFTSEEYTAMDDLKVKDAFIKELEDVIETKYLRFCNPSQPLQFMVLIGGRLSTNLIRFIAHHPRRWASLDQVPVSEQQLVWDIVIQLLEQYSMMQSSSQLRPFAWNVPYFIQWHAVIHVLDTLRADPLHPDSVKAWKLIGNLYENNSELMLNMKKPIFVAVGSLCLKAFNARGAALANEDRTFSRSPEYITKLRDQYEEAKARREATITRIKVRAVPDSAETPNTMGTETRWPYTNSGLEQAGDEAQPQITPQGPLRTGDDSFWLNDALEGAGAVNMMELDIDGIMSQDYWLDNLGGEVIDWEQWDVWLSHGNPDPIC
jgi:Fungal specific transcription factor domain